MKTKFILTAVALALSGGAYATGGGNDGGNATATASHNGNTTATGGNATATGGAGGQGGAGGLGGSASSSANSTNVNVNSLSNKQGQEQYQGQHQGQAQGQLQGQGQAQQANNAGNTQNVTIETHVPKQAPAGPGIASSPSATCRIAVGASVGVVGFSGGAFGSVEDERCADMERGRYMAEVLGRKDAAKSLACQDAKMAKALGDCPAAKKAEASEPTRVGVAAPAGAADLNDPFIRSRLSVGKP